MQAATKPRHPDPITLPATAQALHLYGAAAITLCGWAFARLLHFSWEPYAPLWFAGALLVYNIDRLKFDPSDAINTPVRQATTGRLRRLSIGVIAAAAITLVLLPILNGDWILLCLTVSGGLICANYSLSPLGFRLKDVPLLKTFLAPTIVTTAFVIPPALRDGIAVPPALLASAVGWLWLYLCFNMILCDLRDIAGDTLAGTRSLPVVLGRKQTLRLLRPLLWVTLILGLVVSRAAQAPEASIWTTIALTAAIYEVCLLRALRSHLQSESFYEWWVEGMLLVPPAILMLRLH